MAFIISKMPVTKSCYKLNTNHKHFIQTGLKTSSIFRFDKLATVSKRLILGELGIASPELLSEMKPFFLILLGFDYYLIELACVTTKDYKNNAIV